MRNLSAVSGVVLDVDGPADLRPAAEAAARPGSVPLPGGAWRLWKTFVLRGAGFPASMVARLAVEDEAAAADACEAAGDEVARARDVARAAARTPPLADRQSQRRARAQRRRLGRGGFAESAGIEDEALRRAIDAHAAARRELARACEAGDAAVQERMRDLLCDRRFREALVWQNFHAVDTLVRRLCLGTGSPSEQREAARRVALRAQRYAVKNDSIGFFGPVGWGRLDARPMTIELEHDAELIADRQVYFEGWCIDALADRLNQDHDIRRWTSPRLTRGAWRGDGGVYVPLEGRVAVTAREAAVLALCDGVRTAGEIAEALLAEPGSMFASPSEVADTLDELVKRELVSWRLEVASQRWPERELGERLSGMGDDAARAACLARLDELCGARDRLAAAAGNPEELALRFAELEGTFTRLTGVAPTRNPGATYGARALVYEDCRRACRLALGQPFLDRIGPPLAIVLDAARWIAVAFASAARVRLRQMYAELCERSAGPVDAHRFYTYVRETGGRHITEVTDEMTRRYQEAWRAVLPGGGLPHLRYELAETAARAREVFQPAGDAWSMSSYISPDLMVAAADAEAFGRGEFHGVLGELHAMNSLVASGLTGQHPDPQALASAYADDTQRETVVHLQLGKQDYLARTDALVLPGFLRYDYLDALPSPAGCRSIPAAMLLPVDDGRTVMMRARDGSVQFDALELVGMMLAYRITTIIGARFPRAERMPRVTIGDLTIARETWHIRSGEMPFLGIKDRYLQFAAVRRWAREHGMPRHVFFSSPNEKKPCYLDFCSRTLVEIFVAMMKRARKHKHTRIVEMLPGFDDLWLADARGGRYTCELRLAARFGN